MTLPSCTPARATPGAFHAFIACRARSSRPSSLAAGEAARAAEAAAGEAGFFFCACAGLGTAARSSADKHITGVGLCIAGPFRREANSEFDAQANLTFTARQELCNRAENGFSGIQGRVILI